MSEEGIPTSVVAYMKYPFEYFNPAQSAALAYREQNVNLICSFPTGCHAKGQKILMYDGSFRHVENVKKGDKLMGSDGKPRNVQRLVRGRGEMVRIVPIKGNSFVVNKDHVLTLVQTRLKRNISHRNICPCEYGGMVVDVTVREWLTWSKSKKHIFKLFRVGVDFECGMDLSIDPYFLGIWLGDGSCNGVAVTTGDCEIEKEVHKQAKFFGLSVSYDKGRGCRTLKMVRPRSGGRPNPIKSILRELGLGEVSCETKFIPYGFKVSSRKARLEILAGLMDSDGYTSHGGYEFVTKSGQLAEDVAFVARSLGLAAHVSETKKSSQSGYTGRYHRLFISGDTSVVPTRLRRKKTHKRKALKSVLRTGFRVEPMPDGDFYGFLLDGDGRYLLDDFTVTHNSGKTVVAELVMDHALRSGRKALYASPLKALSQERYDEWRDPNHVFSKYNVSILTGDYLLTPARVKELQEADIVILTSEMLDSKARRAQAEKNEWLMKAGCLIVDEIHLLGTEHRGDALESGLMRFTQHNRWARLVLLSATVANSPELRDWIEKLNGKETALIRSEYRPCPLEVHFEMYDDGMGYHESEAAKQALAIEVMEKYPDDRFLFFVHTKKAGWNLLDALNRRNLKVAFHNAEVARADRLEIEEGFREGRIDHIIATSTLAMGMNLPARRVCILGINRGLKQVHELEILQEVGRAGRPGYDERGDAHILIPYSRYEREKDRFSRLPWVDSQMKTVDVLAFHVISGIERSEIATEEDLVGWYSRSFAVHQKEQVSRGLLLETAQRLQRRKVIEVNRDGHFECLPTGRVAAWYYFSPLDMADWRDNFRKIGSEEEADDHALAWALTHVHSRLQGDNYCPRDMVTYAHRLQELYLSRGLSFDPALVTSTEGLLRHISGKDLTATARFSILDIIADQERILGALEALSKNTKAFAFPPEFWKILGIRLQYGVTREAAPFCLVKGIGTKRARALLDKGFKSLYDIHSHPDLVRQILGPKLSEKLLEEAAKALGKSRIQPQGELF